MELETRQTKRIWPTILVWFAVLVFIAATLAANVYSQRTAASYAPKTLKTMVVKTQTLKRTTIDSGVVEPTKTVSYNIDPSKGKIAEVFVSSGQKVHSGDKLFRYDSTQLSEQMDSLNLKEQSTQMQIDHRSSQIADLEQQISDKEDANAPDGVISQLKSQKDDLAFQNQLSEIDLQQINLQMQQIQDQLNALVVKSTIDGKVQSVADQPYTGQEAIVTVISDGALEVHGSLTEYDAVHVKKGQAAVIEAKALNDHQWKGTVTKVGDVPVSPQGVNTGGEQSVSSYPFTIRLKGRAKLLRPGYHVNVKITIDEHDDVPVVPLDAIQTKGSKSYVFVIQNGKLDRRQIKTGFSNGNVKEVVKGVKAGNKIVIHPSNRLKEGMIVRHDSTK